MKDIKAVITLEVTLSGCTVQHLKQFFAKGKDFLPDGGNIHIDQVVGAAKVQPVPKEMKL